MGDYDHVFKRIVQQSPEPWLRALLPHWRLHYVRHAPTELVSSRREVDALLEVRVSGRKRWIHLEAQTRWNGNVPSRVAEYRTRLLFESQRLVTTVVLLLRKPRKGQLVREGFRVGGHDDHIDVGFRVVRAWKLAFSEATLLRRPALFPLAILSEQTNRADLSRLDELISRAALSPERELDLRVATATLGRLRFSDSLLEVIMSREKMSEHPWFKREREIGRQEALCEAVLRLAVGKAGALPADVEARVRAVSDADRLQELLLDLGQAADERAALAILDRLPPV